MRGSRKQARQRRHGRLRKKVKGTPQRPRLSVHFSHKNIYAQIIDDEKSVTLVAASTCEKSFANGAGKGRSNVAVAKKIGALIAQRALEKNISTVVFDRGGFQFHGRVKALADAARETGLKF
jgi:large subunit ribosomal protein L18